MRLINQMWRGGATSARPLAQVEINRLTVNQEVRASIYETGLVLLHVGNGRLFGSNRAGACIWEGLVDGKSLREIAGELESRFHIPGPQAEVDTVEFITRLHECGFLTRRASC